MSNTNAGGSFRTKKISFTQVSNSALHDTNLSLKAKGLYSLIQSYITIPNFILYKNHLMRICKEGEKAFDSAWKELKTSGYLKQYRIPKGKNDSFVYEYDLLDNADLTTPSLINLNKNGEEITTQKEEIPHFPHLVLNEENAANFAYPPFSTPCERHRMPNGGGINNTNLNNTNLNNTESSQSHTENCQEQRHDMTVTVDKCTTQQKDFWDMKKELLQPTTNHSIGLQSSLKNNALKNNSCIKDDYIMYEEIIKNNISYNHFLQDGSDIALVDNFVSSIVDTILTDDKVKITIGSRENREIKPISIIKSVLMRLNHSHISHAVDQYKGQYHKITYKRQYMRNMLYNTYIEMDAHYTNAVRSDGAIY